ncbi:hypothetical protein C3747_2g53 [Trypanosoma cruzi]|uniref:Dynein assembly factor 2, axonemal homolog n=2 Tax=Trypanosoma cruzi TaxID=5693 RepID=Q4DZZ0_TRYCC|nr:hypothetical protein, conserved [Trypanosoma cruzi]EAN98102.1 hypothetical protein, conserved [Trypanosoma cruzi]PWV21398.1 hypothetical protein C3747_2g53 [Trypanosoma cruzi]RNC56062.1 putative protein kintoun-like [Trypanosoma cruzi]|eukprot:XP_819953.1 hypothetical protein [Trypanosoma cruzi strain CL Brener]
MPLETINLSGKDAQDGEKFTPTPEELRTIQEKMKDPKFVELFHSYMKSMEDPETRREEEAYLKQVEHQAKAGGDYSFDFVFPKPGFVVELLEPSTSYQVTHPSLKAESKKKKHVPRVYVNMCSSEKIDPFSEQSTGDREKSNWLVPVSVSKPRTELFSEEVATSGKTGEKQTHESGEGTNPVVVYDALFHPNTLQLTDRSDRFCCFLVNIAVEHINSGYGDCHGFEFRRLPSRIQSVGTPQNQTISREKGKSPFAAAMNEQALAHPTKVLPPLTSTSEKGRTTPCNKGKETSGVQAKKKTDGEAGDKVEKKEHIPHFTIAHQGHIDLTDTWGWKIVDRRVGVPEALVVKMDFTGVQSAADLNIEVESTYVIIAKSSSHPYYGSVTLPFSVESTPLEAKFERRKSRLTLVLRVVPPAPTGITAEDMRQELISAGDPPDSVTEHAEDVVTERKNKDSAQDSATAGCVANDETSTVSDLLPAEARPTAVELPKETPSVPQFSCVGDQDRVRIVMEKVQAARLEREKAAAAAEEQEVSFAKTGSDPQEKENDDDPAKESAGNPEHEPQREVVTGSTALEAAASTPTFTLTEVSATAGADDAVHVEDGTKTAEGAAGLELLRQRQDAWQREIHRRTEARHDEDREKALIADREARREAERLRRRAEAAKLQEAAAVKLAERMAELPLRNRHIFTVD